MYMELPPPNGLTQDEVDEIIKVIEGKVSESTTQEVATQPQEAVATTTQEQPQEHLEVELLDELEELLRSKRIATQIPKIASILVSHVVKKFNVKVPVVNDNPLGIYCYNEGAYEECEEIIENLLYEYYTLYSLEEKGIRYRSLRNEFIAQLEDAVKVFRGFDHHLLLFKNGIFSWDKLERGEDPRVEPSPEYMILHRIDHEVDWSLLNDKNCYEDLEKCAERKTPFFKKVFQDWVGDKWILLYEVLGYTLYTKGYPFNKAVMLVGEGRNGKSTYLTLMKSILGSKNVTSITLQEITTDKFAGSELFGKLANIYADLPNEMVRQTGKFKILTGEDYVCTDRKYKSRLCFTNYAKLIFSCNKLPAVTDTTLAFWRRWVVVEFPNQFPDNPKFKEMLLNHPEIPQLIALSIIVFKKVLERGKFSYQEEATDYREVWMRNVDPVYDFLKFMEEKGYTVRDKNGRVYEKDLYELYTTYHNNYRDDEVLPKKTFTEKLESYGITKKPITGKRYYVGISLLKPLSEIKRELEQTEEPEETLEYLTKTEP